VTKFGFSIPVVVAMLATAAPASSHHSFSVEYGANKPVAFEGVVSKIEWTNPHVRVYVDVNDGKGPVRRWNMELASPSALARNGWSSRTPKIERYTRLDAGRMQIKITIDDPGAYVQPFTLTFMARLAPGDEIMENICRENNQFGIAGGHVKPQP
jgi:hypothetical protein